MARKCCVIDCDDLTKEDIIYFPAPIKAVLFKAWAKAVKPAKLTAESYVCHQHFLPDDYQMLRGRHRLKAKVVPSLFGENINNKNNKIEKDTTEKDNKSDQSESVNQLNNEPVKENNSELNNELNQNNDIDLNSELNLNNELNELDRHSSDSVDENGLEKCTIECQPEAFLQCPSDSEPDTDLHKEDIEDIIANYHIKQNKHVADLLKQDSLKNTKQNDIPPDKDKPSKAKGQIDPKAKSNWSQLEHFDESTDSSDIQYVGPGSNKAEFIEVSVNSGTNNDGDTTNDCMMLLESVQVDVDPSLLLSCQDHDDHGDEKPDPISLLTSSDEDDVILQEPHIDTVEVSDATDEDDVPLVKLVDTKPKLIPRKINNETLIELRVCEICDYTTSSASQMSRHKRKHNEKRYKCNLCEYRAMHNMSLIYHMRSHKDVNVKTINFIPEESDYVKLKNNFKCIKCSFKCKSKSEITKHCKKCSNRNIKFLHKCDKCGYRTGRKHDLRRHMVRKHMSNDDFEDEDYVP